MTAPVSGVKVRMYRQGLGDCFLLAFPSTGRSAKPRFVLIDCGVLLGTPEGVDRVRRVAEHIVESTGGRLDLLVATHEHWDHLSGFEQARDIFDKLKIEEVWVAWTEDPDDSTANGLRHKRETALRALTSSAMRLRATGDEDAAASAGQIDSVLGFFGELGVDGKPKGIERAMDYVCERGKPPRYRQPGEGPLPLPGVPGARVYVLGPPRGEELKRSDPRAGEAYEKSLALNEETAFFAAALAAHEKAGELAMSLEERELERLSYPFDKAFRVKFDQAKADPFFQELYYGAASAAGAAGEASDKELAWRRIEADWMGASKVLALKLDSDTNNTSLALAIELVGTGKVLLFPGDAQAGSWRSWHGLTWPRDGKPDDPVTTVDLLKRTVLYKVGHHASHNATLRGQGLELMEHPDLVAMIPVHEEMAHKPKGGSPKGWDMPFPPLLNKLNEKARGRVLRVDKGLPTCPGNVPAKEWKEFADRCVEDELYVEITIPD
jgi:hypothetical protein